MKIKFITGSTSLTRKCKKNLHLKPTDDQKTLKIKSEIHDYIVDLAVKHLTFLDSCTDAKLIVRYVSLSLNGDVLVISENNKFDSYYIDVPKKYNKYLVALDKVAVIESICEKIKNSIAQYNISEKANSVIAEIVMN